MRNLLYFFVRHSAWMVYLLFAVFSIFLLVRYNPYQQSVWLTSSNEMTGRIYDITGSISGYFHLKQINRDLLERNGQLEMEVIRLQSELRKSAGEKLSERTGADSALYAYDFTVARVINNSFSRVHNYITLNKGSEDGIRPEMGVVDQNGIVGIVSTVSEHFSVVISLLNPKLRLSCKVKGSDYFGSLVWEGTDPQYAVLEELPRHVKFAVGDTIVTSGYSAVFPEGVPVGTVDGYSRQKNDNFYAVKVALSTDFCRLSNVRVIRNRAQEEQRKTEKEAGKNE